MISYTTVETLHKHFGTMGCEILYDAMVEYINCKLCNSLYQCFVFIQMQKPLVGRKVCEYAMFYVYLVMSIRYFMTLSYVHLMGKHAYPLTNSFDFLFFLHESRTL